MELPDAATMTPEQRIHVVEVYRNRMLAGEHLTVEEMNHAIKCIAADRSSQMRERRKASTEARKASIVPLDSDEI